MRVLTLFWVALGIVLSFYMSGRGGILLASLSDSSSLWRMLTVPCRDMCLLLSAFSALAAGIVSEFSRMLAAFFAAAAGIVSLFGIYFYAGNPYEYPVACLYLAGMIELLRDSDDLCESTGSLISFLLGTGAGVWLVCSSGVGIYMARTGWSWGPFLDVISSLNPLHFYARAAVLCFVGALIASVSHTAGAAAMLFSACYCGYGAPFSFSDPVAFSAVPVLMLLGALCSYSRIDHFGGDGNVKASLTVLAAGLACGGGIWALFRSGLAEIVYESGCDVSTLWNVCAQCRGAWRTVMIASSGALGAFAAFSGFRIASAVMTVAAGLTLFLAVRELPGTGYAPLAFCLYSVGAVCAHTRCRDDVEDVYEPARPISKKLLITVLAGAFIAGGALRVYKSFSTFSSEAGKTPVVKAPETDRRGIPVENGVVVSRGEFNAERHVDSGQNNEIIQRRLAMETALREAENDELRQSVEALKKRVRELESCLKTSGETKKAKEEGQKPESSEMTEKK